jgi:integrase
LTFRLGQLPAEDAFVLVSLAGTVLDSRNVTQNLQAVLTRLGFPHQRFHDLRHAFATLQLEAGAETSEVSRALGHSNISTTADIYGHLTEVTCRRTAARMDEILGPKRAASGGV